MYLIDFSPLKYDSQSTDVTIPLEYFQLLMVLSSHMELDIVDYYGNEGQPMKRKYSDIKEFYSAILNGWLTSR